MRAAKQTSRKELILCQDPEDPEWDREEDITEGPDTGREDRDTEEWDPEEWGRGREGRLWGRRPGRPDAAGAGAPGRTAEEAASDASAPFFWVPAG